MTDCRCYVRTQLLPDYLHVELWWLRSEWSSSIDLIWRFGSHSLMTAVHVSCSSLFQRIVSQNQFVLIESRLITGVVGCRWKQVFDHSASGGVFKPTTQLNWTTTDLVWVDWSVGELWTFHNQLIWGEVTLNTPINWSGPSFNRNCIKGLFINRHIQRFSFIRIVYLNRVSRCDRGFRDNLLEIPLFLEYSRTQKIMQVCWKLYSTFWLPYHATINRAVCIISFDNIDSLDELIQLISMHSSCKWWVTSDLMTSLRLFLFNCNCHTLTYFKLSCSYKKAASTGFSSKCTGIADTSQILILGIGGVDML
jgi:hypothetical protein